MTGPREGPVRPRHVEALWAVDARTRVLIAGALGLLVGSVVALFVPWEAAVLLGWVVTALVTVTWIMLTAWRFTPDETRRYANREDDSRLSADLLLVTACLVSLVGVLLDLIEARRAGGTEEVLLVSLASVTVILSWLVVQITFGLRYAHEYYAVDEVGGIDFKSGADYQPDYRDFFYVAFTVGMTWQVSDTDVQARRIRRTVLKNALLSYAFGAVILATLINVVASLLR